MNAPAVRTRSRTADVKAKEAVGEATKAVSELDKMMQDFQKLHGANAFRTASTMPQFVHTPFGVFVIDLALLGGLPQSLITMIYGWESGGKSTMTSRVIGRMQRNHPDRRVVLIEPEGTFDPAWARRHGVDTDTLLIGQGDTGEQNVDMAVAALEARETSLLVIDSLPALMPAKEQEKSAEDDIVALQARLVGRFVRKATDIIVNERKRNHWPAILLINQWRNKIQMMGDPRSLPGGNALKFFVSCRFEILNKETMGRDANGIEIVDYNDHTIRVTKNKAGNAIRNAEFRMIRNPSHPRGQGFIDEAETIITFARKFDYATGGGSSWRLRDVDQKFGRLSDMGEYLYDNPEYCEWLKTEIISDFRESMGKKRDGWQATQV